MAGRDCPLCGALGTGDNDFSVAVFTGGVAEVRLERRSRLPGYCTVAWKLGHVSEPADLDPVQAGRYWCRRGTIRDHRNGTPRRPRTGRPWPHRDLGALLSLAWAAGITLVFAPLAAALYRRSS
jgi:hypothetical protein